MVIPMKFQFVRGSSPAIYRGQPPNEILLLPITGLVLYNKYWRVLDVFWKHVSLCTSARTKEITRITYYECCLWPPPFSSLSVVNTSKHLSNTVWYRPIIEINQILNKNYNLGRGLLLKTLVSSGGFPYRKNKKNR